MNLFTQTLITPQFQPLLPFFFVLAIVYGLLNLVKIFDKNSINLIIALVFGFFASSYPPFLYFFYRNFGFLLWTFIILFFIAFFLEALGLRKKKVPEGKEHIPMMMGSIILILLVTMGFGIISKFEIPFLGTENFMVIVGLFLLGLIFYYAYELGGG